MVQLGTSSRHGTALDMGCEVQVEVEAGCRVLCANGLFVDGAEKREQ